VNVHVPVIDFDRAELRRKLPQCVAALSDLLDAGEPVYLHCTAGVNRSPTVAAAFLHWKRGWDLDQAVAHLQAVRNCCPDGEVIREAGLLTAECAEDAEEGDGKASASSSNLKREH